MKRENLLPKAPFGRILQDSGAKRVSQEAMDALTEVMTDIAEDIGRKSMKIAKHAGRKTVTGSDVKFAVKLE